MTAGPIPLFLTRQAEANRRFTALLSPRVQPMLRLIKTPLFKTEAVKGVSVPTGAFAAIFTSSSGVRFGPPSDGRLAYCVGAQTRETAIAAGWNAQMAGRTAAELVENLSQDKPALPLVHFSGRHHRGDVAERLSALGFEAVRREIYDQPLLPMSQQARDALAMSEPVLVPLFSPRIAAHAATFIPCGATVRVIAMSDAVRAALPRRLHGTTYVAAQPSAQAVVDIVEKLVIKDSLG